MGGGHSRWERSGSGRRWTSRVSATSEVATRRGLASAPWMAVRVAQEIASGAQGGSEELTASAREEEEEKK